MARMYKPYRVYKRPDTKSWEFSLTTVSGLPEEVCAVWRRKNFQNLPVELAVFREPKTKTAAETAATALIQYLAKAVLLKEQAAERVEVERKLEKMPTSTVSSQLLIHYVLDFWTTESKYAQEKAMVRKEALSTTYIKLNHDDVKRHVATFPGFQSMTLGELTAGHIRDWMIWAAGKGLSGRRINSVLQAMRVAIRDPEARVRINVRIKRLGEGNPGDSRFLGEVSELRIHH